MPVSTRSNPGLFSLPLIPLQQEPPAVWSPGFSRDQRAGVSDLIIPLETLRSAAPVKSSPGRGSSDKRQVGGKMSAGVEGAMEQGLVLPPHRHF